MRSWKGWSHEKLAKEARALLPHGEKLSAKTVGNVEKGRHNVTVGKLRGIAAAFGVEMWQLFLPPSHDSQLSREVVVEIGRRSPDDQRDVLKIVKKLAVVPPPAPTEPPEVSLRPSVRRASSGG